MGLGVCDTSLHLLYKEASGRHQKNQAFILGRWGQASESRESVGGHRHFRIYCEGYGAGIWALIWLGFHAFGGLQDLRVRVHGLVKVQY